MSLTRPTPLQNRVTPTGEIVADPGRGLLMGNRGCLHRPDGRLGTARWRTKSWICCTLTWKGIRRDPMPPGRWTALFFLDEATALAAGHRPCAYCRRADFLAFAEGWRRACKLAQRPRAPEIDARLHYERADPRSRRQLTRPGVVDGLPDGVMLRHGGVVGLLAGGRLLPWSFSGYMDPLGIPPGTSVELLTPPATVAVIAAGYRPLLHPSAALGIPLATPPIASSPWRSLDHRAGGGRARRGRRHGHQRPRRGSHRADHQRHLRHHHRPVVVGRPDTGGAER